MKDREMKQLNLLFEKMVSNNANIREQRELASLYQNFIDEDREGINNVSYINAEEQFG